jgi:hypothetical protein
MKRETISPVVSALLKGRAAVEANWCQGFGVGDQVCAVEALWRRGAKAIVFPLAFLERALPVPWISVMGYNDAKETTKADILALYDRAIELALKAER